MARMKRLSWRIVPPWAGLVLLLLLLIVHSAQAHGGGTPRLVNEDIGPYWLSVWTSPDPPRVGELHLTIGLSEPGVGRSAGDAVLGADVEVQLAPQATAEEAIVAAATNAQSTNKLFYETDVQVPRTGTWDVTIRASGPAGSGSATFSLAVQEESGLNWPLVGAAALAMVVVVVVVQSRRGREN